MKKACVVISYWYLSVPIYLSLKELYPKYDWKLIDPNEFMGMDTNNIFRKNKSQKIKGYTLINTGLLSTIFKIKIFSPWLKSFLFYFFYSYYNSLLIEYFNKENFDHIVLTSDWFHSAKSIGSCSELCDKSILIQPCYLDLWKRKLSVNKVILPYPFVFAIKTFLRKKIFPLHPILKINETRFGFINKKVRLLIWDENLSEFYKEVGRKFELISNPIYKSLFKKYKSYNVRNLDKGLPIVTLFPADYTLNFGIDYQEKLIAEYKLLFKDLSTNYEVRLKIHPNENILFWKKIFKTISSDKIIKEEDPHKVIFESDFIISTNSYSSVEALLIGTPCINLNPNSELISITNPEIYTKFSLLNASDYKMAKNYIDKSLIDNNYQKYLQDLSLKAKELLGQHPEIKL